jgi:hypothetical protein
MKTSSIREAIRCCKNLINFSKGLDKKMSMTDCLYAKLIGVSLNEDSSKVEFTFLKNNETIKLTIQSHEHVELLINSIK